MRWGPGPVKRDDGTGEATISGAGQALVGGGGDERSWWIASVGGVFGRTTDLAPAHALGAGFTVERTRRHGEDRDIQRGLPVYSYPRRLRFSGYALNVRGTENGHYVGGVDCEF